MTEQTAYARDVDHHAQVASVVEAFERQVDTDPERDAIRGPKPTTGAASFGELDAWANAIAAELIFHRGSKPEPVPLMVCSPELMLAAALGALKAGKFYVAVNPMHPAPHVQRVLDELDAPLLLCDRLGESVVRRDLLAISVEETIEARPYDPRPGLRFDESRLAYVLYTSGSTGRPRGVAQSRRDMLHNVARHQPLGIGHGDCVTLISADGFVASVSNPYIALLGGATLAPYSFRYSGVEGMIDWLEATGVTVLYGFPSFLRQLAAAEATRVFGGLRLAYLGGETVLPADLAAARRLFPAAALSVGLNSSETGLTCLHIVSAGSSMPDPVPAGRPVRDVEIAIVGASGTSRPPGECGEIEISSDYVRPRYWRRGGVQDDDPLALAFRTGDRGRIDADGIVYHLGRVDQMVKIRGFRVETSEVEAAISALPGVAEVAVFGVGEEPETELTACCVAQSANVDPVAVRGAVARELPSAMIPTRVLIVDALPRTPNGKLDRKRLARLASHQDADTSGTGATMAEPGARLQTAREHARGAVERRIADIWKAELAVDRVAADEDFFALGGTSLTAVSIISRVRGEFGVLVPLAALFRTPTVSALAAAVIELQDQHTTGNRRACTDVVVRSVQERDFPDICALVNHYIEHTSFNFRTEPQVLGEWIEDWSATRSSYPWLTAIVDSVLAGVAYAGPWKGRAAYDWCAEVTVYVAHDFQRMGIGRALYERLLRTLDSQGYRTQVAVITLPNPASVALHETCGFHRAGTLGGVGYKHGEWLDVGFWQRGEPQRGVPPAPITAVPSE
jgi:acyl-coenzyme A synthetase/AMP-(fatty) acid ligase/L-amino acid N-acyltransferase YncA/acyl carrier protein